MTPYAVAFQNVKIQAHCKCFCGPILQMEGQALGGMSRWPRDPGPAASNQASPEDFVRSLE